MDFKKILSFKLAFVKNYLSRIKGCYLALPWDWFYVTEPTSDKDAYGHQSFRIIDLFREYKNDIIAELREEGITVTTLQKKYIFEKC